jgi:hypothetical protein
LLNFAIKHSIMSNLQSTIEKSYNCKLDDQKSDNELKLIKKSSLEKVEMGENKNNQQNDTQENKEINATKSFELNKCLKLSKVLGNDVIDFKTLFAYDSIEFY